MKIRKMALILLAVVGIVGLLVSGCVSEPNNIKIGKITDIRVSAGDNQNDLTQLIFDDGSNLVLSGAYSEFIIGHKYEIAYKGGTDRYRGDLVSFKEVK